MCRAEPFCCKRFDDRDLLASSAVAAVTTGVQGADGRARGVRGMLQRRRFKENDYRFSDTTPRITKPTFAGRSPRRRMK
jgi:hypothetical protein